MNAPTDFSQARPLREKLVVIGNGMAGCRAVEEILARNPDRYSITIFGAEPRVNYNRIMLSPVLAGEKSFDEIVLNTAEWYSENGIELVFFLVGRRMKPAHPLLADEDVAGGAFAGAAAEALQGQAPIPDDLHHAPALDAFEGVALAFAVDHVDDAHETGIP